MPFSPYGGIGPFTIKVFYIVKFINLMFKKRKELLEM